MFCVLINAIMKPFKLRNEANESLMKRIYYLKMLETPHKDDTCWIWCENSPEIPKTKPHNLETTCVNFYLMINFNIMN